MVPAPCGGPGVRPRPERPEVSDAYDAVAETLTPRCGTCRGRIILREIGREPALLVSWCETERTFGFVPSDSPPRNLAAPAGRCGGGTVQGGSDGSIALSRTQRTEPGPTHPRKRRVCPDCGEVTFLPRGEWYGHRKSHRPWLSATHRSTSLLDRESYGTVHEIRSPVGESGGGPSQPGALSPVAAEGA